MTYVVDYLVFLCVWRRKGSIVINCDGVIWENIYLQWHGCVCEREKGRQWEIKWSIIICVSNHVPPVVIASGLMLTVKQMDWLGPTLPDDGDTVHSSPSPLLSVGAAIALQSNHQFTCFLTLRRQNTFCSPTAFSSTVCGGREEWQTWWVRQQKHRR